MKKLIFTIMFATVGISVWGQLKGIDTYQRTKDINDLFDKDGIRFYHKSSQEAYFGYSCYVFLEPDEEGNYLFIEDDCRITEQNAIDIFNELVSVLKSNGADLNDYIELTGTDTLTIENVLNSLIMGNDFIYAYYKIGVSVIFFSADSYSVELQMMDRKAKRSFRLTR
jgi:uncharacterized protein YerC